MVNYYIADLHFGHKNILHLDQRPFASLEEMEETIVTNWNAAVQPGDTVYILGDFCWDKTEEWLRILRRLHGQKVLIRGNHDPRQYPEELQREFVSISDYQEIRDNGRHVILCHYPILFYQHSSDPNYYMLCGHVHRTAENDYLERWRQELRGAVQSDPATDHSAHRGQIYNVGVMMPYMSYTPRTLDEILGRADL